MRANVTVAPKAPGSATTDFKTIVRSLDQVTLAVVTFADGSAAVVADEKWLGELKRLIASADGHAASYCFCLNYPAVALLNKDREIATLEVAHSQKLRFGGQLFSGDFQVEEKTARAIVILTMAQRSNAVPSRANLARELRPPVAVEIKP